MKINIGDQIPSVDFFHLDNNKILQKINSRILFKKQKAILIGVPGAFTNVCSAKHLPGYVNNFEEAKKKELQKLYVFQLMIQM